MHKVVYGKLQNTGPTEFLLTFFFTEYGLNIPSLYMHLVDYTVLLEKDYEEQMFCTHFIFSCSLFSNWIVSINLSSNSLALIQLPLVKYKQ